MFGVIDWNVILEAMFGNVYVAALMFFVLIFGLGAAFGLSKEQFYVSFVATLLTFALSYKMANLYIFIYFALILIVGLVIYRMLAR